jgi:hypothetical protein
MKVKSNENGCGIIVNEKQSATYAARPIFLVFNRPTAENSKSPVYSEHFITITAANI